jgi:hypothetical protein
MVTVLEDCTTEEQPSIVIFFCVWAKGHSAADIYKEIFTMGSVCRVKRFITEWQTLR